jgi:aminoglycoside phosphotransferase (APT) family kinase protein
MTGWFTAARGAAGQLSASLPEEVSRLLRVAGLIAANERPSFTPLTGGVSSEIWRIDLAAGPVCVKRALPRLRVAQHWEAPIERNRYERMWLDAAGTAVPGAAPRILASDDEAGLFAMQCLDLPLWKDLLRQGKADARFAGLVGTTLAAIHTATAGRPDVAARFATDDIFHAIRLEPYLVATGKAHPDLQERFDSLVRRTAKTRVCLVHGDVSPKNILVGTGGPVFLDAECAWYGDPAFDLAFCLNHLLVKCLWVPRARADVLQCFDSLARGYLAGIPFAGLEGRAASLLPALLLARVDGKSPVEYLTEKDRELVRTVARELLPVATTLEQIRRAWQRSLT